MRGARKSASDTIAGTNPFAACYHILYADIYVWLARAHSLAVYTGDAIVRVLQRQEFLQTGTQSDYRVSFRCVYPACGCRGVLLWLQKVARPTNKQTLCSGWSVNDTHPAYPSCCACSLGGGGVRGDAAPRPVSFQGAVPCSQKQLLTRYAGTIIYADTRACLQAVVAGQAPYRSDQHHRAVLFAPNAGGLSLAGQARGPGTTDRATKINTKKQSLLKLKP